MVPIICVAIVCGSSLAAWVLWLRQYPPVTRKDWLDLVAAAQMLRNELNTVKNAVALRPALQQAPRKIG